VALDDHGRILAELTVGSNPRELDRLARWIAGMGPERVVAIEGARGFGLALSRRLLVAGETVVDVAPALTVGERRAARRPGKDDRGDAVAVARIAMREQGLPRASAETNSSDLKLVVDARDQLVAEATRTRNRLHALLLVIAPGYHEQVRDLTSSTALMVARRLASRARRADRVRSTLACAAISRLRSLSGEIGALERELTAALDREAPANLLAICGVGPLVAAKILGEARDVGRFSSSSAFASYAGTAPIPASSGTVIRHRLDRWRSDTMETPRRDRCGTEGGDASGQTDEETGGVRRGRGDQVSVMISSPIPVKGSGAVHHGGPVLGDPVTHSFLIRLIGIEFRNQGGGQSFDPSFNFGSGLWLWMVIPFGYASNKTT